MKYLRKFNESIDQSDIEDIEDLFKEYADELVLHKLQELPSNWGNNFEGLHNSYLITSYKDHDEIRFSGDHAKRLLGYRTPDRIYLYVFYPKFSQDLESKLKTFVNRVKKIGYKCIGPDISSSFQGLIPHKIVIWNDELSTTGSLPGESVVGEDPDDTRRATNYSKFMKRPWGDYIPGPDEIS